MPIIAYTFPELIVDGQKFDQIVTIAFDSAARRIRGRAICSGSDFQMYLRKLRTGDVVRVTLTVGERSEISNQSARVVMLRIRMRNQHVMSIFFSFALNDE